jgi:hypothetical protein
MATVKVLFFRMMHALELTGAMESGGIDTLWIGQRLPNVVL